MLNPLEAPYRIDGEFVVPGPNARGGWDERLQSGHVLAPLLAHLVETVPTLTPMLTTRCIVDLTRAVPRRPLRWRREIVRQGKKLQVVRAALYEGDTEYVSLTALRARLADSPAVPLRTYGGPQQVPLIQEDLRIAGYELLALDGAKNGGGSCKVWSRLLREVVEGVAVTPFVHAMSIADFGNGLANALSFDDWNFPNIDIVVMFLRPPEGEWLLLDAETEIAGNGLGVVSGTLADARGAFARSHQTLFIDPVS